MILDLMNAGRKLGRAEAVRYGLKSKYSNSELKRVYTVLSNLQNLSEYRKGNCLSIIEKCRENLLKNKKLTDKQEKWVDDHAYLYLLKTKRKADEIWLNGWRAHQALDQRHHFPTRNIATNGRGKEPSK